MIPGYEVSVMMNINRSTRIVRITRPLLATRFCSDTKFFSLTAINRSTKFSFNRFGPALRCLNYFVWPVSTETSTGKFMRSTYVQRRSCNKWCSAHNHILSCARKFLPLDWFGTIGILTTLTKMSNEHELETVYKLWKIILPGGLDLNSSTSKLLTIQKLNIEIFIFIMVRVNHEFINVKITKRKLNYWCILLILLKLWCFCSILKLPNIQICEWSFHGSTSITSRMVQNWPLDTLNIKFSTWTFHDSRLSKIDSKSFRALLLRFPGYLILLIIIQIDEEQSWNCCLRMILILFEIFRNRNIRNQRFELNVSLNLRSVVTSV